MIENLVLVRHGETPYNAEYYTRDHDYADFKSLFEQTAKHPNLPDEIACGSWPPRHLRDRAFKVYAQMRKRITTTDATTPLAPRGHQQAVQTGAALPGRLETLLRSDRLSAVYCSPYPRARETYDGVIEGWPALKDADFIVDPLLREREHGLRNAYAGDRRLFFVFHPEQYLLWRVQGEAEYRYPQGESIGDVKDRAEAFLEKLARKRWCGNLLAITHHLFMLAIQAVMANWSDEHFEEVNRTDRPENCCVTICRNHQDGVFGWNKEEVNMCLHALKREKKQA